MNSIKTLAKDCANQLVVSWRSDIHACSLGGIRQILHMPGFQFLKDARTVIQYDVPAMFKSYSNIQDST